MKVAQLDKLLSIANEMADEYVTNNGDRDLVCAFCDTNVHDTYHGFKVNHNTNCPILKLEAFKLELKDNKDA